MCVTFADATKLGRVRNLLGDSIISQEDLDRLER
jgi:hypothetical protein